MNWAKATLAYLRPTLILFALLVVLTGLVYPLAITGIAQALFPFQANGSLIRSSTGGSAVGSALIGQSFDNPKYFWGRVSDTSPYPYNGASSAGSNLGPTNPALIQQVKQRIADLKKYDPGNTQPIPVDLVTASGSGLDPDISPAAAYYQAGRVARERGLSVATVDALIQQHIQGRFLGILGEPSVNVLELNLALDKLK
ncbi:MAG: potassium-transporting ATPase subunit KdpC [Chloroflexi bacterium]|nr:potassium-transporting ATPase subunit KdpC [Chloroflexota bacterium]